jgi:nucleoside-diphosphate-sugar epimerase
LKGNNAQGEKIMRVIVTGTSGKVGPWVAREFVAHGWEVLGIDVRPPTQADYQTIVADLEDLGQVYGLCARFRPDAVVHMAAIPWPGGAAPDRVFQLNSMTTYNVLQACADLGIPKVVTASSESAYGIVFAEHDFDPLYLPLDEAHPLLPQDPYALSKQVGELTCAMFHRRTGIQAVSFRLGNVQTPETYVHFPAIQANPASQKSIFWSYIDARDIGTASRLAVEADGLGAEVFHIAAPDTKMTIPTRELLARYWPNVTDLRTPLEGFAGCLSTAKAERLLGWQADHRWRAYVRTEA